MGKKIFVLIIAMLFLSISCVSLVQARASTYTLTITFKWRYGNKDIPDDKKADSYGMPFVSNSTVQAYRIDSEKRWILVAEEKTDSFGVVKFKGLKDHGYTFVLYWFGDIVDTHSLKGSIGKASLSIDALS